MYNYLKITNFITKFKYVIFYDFLVIFNQYVTKEMNRFSIGFWSSLPKPSAFGKKTFQNNQGQTNEIC